MAFIKIGRKLTDFVQSSNLATYLMFLVVLTLFVATTARLTGLDLDGKSDLGTSKASFLDSGTGLYGSIVLLFACGLYLAKRPNPIYLVDFACYKPGDELKVSNERFLNLTKDSNTNGEMAVEFQRRIIARSGLGEETYIPRGIISKPQNICFEEALYEAQSVMFGSLDSLFDKTGVKPHEIGILIVNSGIFNPTPSLSAMIVNRYKLNPDIKSYSLAGMGCSATVISVDLAKNLLKSNRNTYAIVVSLECLTLAWYSGNDKSILLSNSIFRSGGAAVLLSNRSKDRTRSKYELVHTVRTHKGADDNSYNCVQVKEDDNGFVGLSLGRDLMAVAGDTLKTNIATIAPLVLPLSEKFKFLVALVQTKFMKGKKVKPYTPNFKKAFQHFCIHCGGRGVLDAMQKNLQLNDWYMEPSRMTLHRWGNTSSSSLWYELAYTESKGRVSKGDRVWQIAFGSGFKCNSAVWKALKRIPSLGDGGERRGNPWVDSIDKYPVEVPKE